MRLLNASTMKLHQFIGDANPKYAILSHTWREEEVLFEDISKPVDQISGMVGFFKVERCCKQALDDGWDYVWIDTCCINKDSSAELSEAINSMYEWYKAAEVCYAFLADVGLDSTFVESRWFSRGWTLQELLAPRRLIFYDCHWEEIGTKQTLLEEVEAATGIMRHHIDRPQNANIAQRMSWASRRDTTRKEDLAYSLLGIFDVNMPLLYGEGGRKAFLRLQQEIIKISSDETIFAWTNARLWSCGMFAESPKDFANSRDILVEKYPRFRTPYAVTNRGLDFAIDGFLGDPFDGITTPLACYKDGVNRQLSLHLKPLAHHPGPNVEGEMSGHSKRDTFSMMRVDVNSHSSFRSKLSRNQASEVRNQGSKFYVRDIVCTRATATRTFRAHGRCKQSAPCFNSPFRFQEHTFIFNVTSTAFESVFYLNSFHFKDFAQIPVHTMITKDVPMELEEFTAALAFLDERSHRSLVIRWRCDPSSYSEEPCIIVHSNLLHRYDDDEEGGRTWCPLDGWQEPHLVSSGSSFRDTQDPISKHFVWVGLRKREFLNDAWTVDVDVSEAKGLGNQGQNLHKRVNDNTLNR